MTSRQPSHILWRGAYGSQCIPIPILDANPIHLVRRPPLESLLGNAVLDAGIDKNGGVLGLSGLAHNNWGHPPSGNNGSLCNDR